MSDEQETKETSQPTETTGTEPTDTTTSETTGTDTEVETDN